MMYDTRRTICTMLDSRMRRRCKPFDVTDWAASAIVFAPHPDDETLGCGGVAAKKLRAGVEVRFVFVTDGARSHTGSMGPEALRAMREEEAIEAVRRLGASPECVTFLRLPDGAASQHIREITEAVAPLLNAWRPESVFICHAKDPHPDHLAVNTAVRAALRADGRPVTVFEYPVWYWYHWPWVRILGDLPDMWRISLRQTIKTTAGLRTPSTLNSIAYMGDVIDIKREALAAHASQMKRQGNKDDWQTLADLSGGDFVARLVANYEMFTRYEL